MSDGAASPYRIYWTTWVALLIITVLMLAAEALHMPRWFLVAFLVSFMFVKAVMIAGNFMHLRYEHRRLIVTVGVGLLVTSAILLAYIAPESRSVFHKTLR
ncbi:MAG TPA: cytochrome C oxidase subunit IV family protein [Vicinamibacteria bacterium]|nr:cytochrome C oxidase subunit IV family protein [Vicinamibacteria bacterium]